ncbi:hypothetical protein [Turicimonas muris]|uniref:hypothetical protein n=1 Tax=Turicimonas muris TaxID=1796652 RepID=UPI001C3E9838|nr:hypothetical protein [Turicimonas muris]
MSLKVLNRIPIRFKDGKTRWITIKGAHVPVDKDGELKGKTGNKIENDKNDSKNTAKSFDLKRFLTRLNSNEDPKKVLSEAASSIKGTYRVNLPDVGETNVEIAQDFVRESGKYLYPPFRHLSREQKREVAKRQLFGMANLDKIFSEGIRSTWTRHHEHHKEYEFCSFFRKLEYRGKEVMFTVDIRRKKIPESRVYNTSNSRNFGFRKKLKSTVIPIKRIGDSSVSYIYEIADLVIE